MPVAFLTGRSTPVHERLAFERGALDFIDKSRDTRILAAGLRLVAGSAKGPLVDQAHPAEVPGVRPDVRQDPLVLRLRLLLGRAADLKSRQYETAPARAVQGSLDAPECGSREKPDGCSSTPSSAMPGSRAWSCRRSTAAGRPSIACVAAEPSVPVQPASSRPPWS